MSKSFDRLHGINTIEHLPQRWFVSQSVTLYHVEFDIGSHVRSFGTLVPSMSLWVLYFISFIYGIVASSVEGDKVFRMQVSSREEMDFIQSFINVFLSCSFVREKI
jgi:hypothetical protein